jgi:hypothetical protein
MTKLWWSAGAVALIVAMIVLALTAPETSMTYHVIR